MSARPSRLLSMWIWYRTSSPNAYRSVLSATGSFEISGASRCDDMNYLTGSNGQRAGSAERPGDPGGQLLVLQLDLAGSVEHLDVPGLGVAHVQDDGTGRQRLHHVVVARCRAVGSRPGLGRAHGGDGQAGRAG